MKTKFIYIAVIIIAALGLAACDDDNKPSFDFSSDVDIRSFVINGVKGDINQTKGTIDVLLPTGTDLSSISPVIEVASGATVSPASGETVDFSVSRTYTVSNGDIHQTYAVNVDVVKAQITRFVIDGREGKINQQDMTILIYMGKSADLTALSPVVEYTSGAELTPASGKSVNFSSPVTYSLIYEGSTFNYVVTALAFDPPLVLYNGEDVIGGWWDAGNAYDLNLKTANPVTSGINDSQYCGSFTFDKGADPWRGAGLSNLNINPQEYNRFSAMFLKQSAGILRMEIQGAGGDNMSIEHEYDASKLGQWQEFVFELPVDHTFTVIHTVLVAPHLEDTANDQTFITHKMYFDEVKVLPNID